jgi:Fic family protein
MGYYETQFWLSDTRGANRRERQSGAYHPFVPDKLSDTDHLLTPEASEAAAQAQADIQRLDLTTPHLANTEPIARLILRAEAVASSKIEGLQISAGKLLEYEALDELGVSHRIGSTEAAVLGNISSMEESINTLSSKSSFDVDDICSINKKLLEHTDLADYGGVIRTQQNWIGGNNVNPIGAAYVPPRPELVLDYIEDLAKFIATAQMPGIALAAIAHAQLETIHPFADGNGRTGRTLVQVILRRSGLAQNVVPPISLILATDKARYIDNLAAYRWNENAEEQRSRILCESDWVEYFARSCSLACKRAHNFNDTLESILSDWREKVHPRANSAADLLLPKLIGNPVISITSAARLCGRSTEAARNAIATLSEAGVLYQSSKNRKSNLYVAREVVDAFTGYEIRLASPAGDTAVALPSRPAPQRPRH